MKSERAVGAYHAKTHLSQLLDEVEAGAVVAITRNGRAVARLVPAREGREDARRAAEELLALQEDLTLGDLSVDEMVRYGRR